MLKASEIISTGSYLPEQCLTNEQLKQFPSTVRNLIEIKTGVKARRFADPSECTSDLALEAGRRCLAKVNFDPQKLDGIILATSTPDRPQPATATRVQYKLGASQAFAFDLNSVCSGAVFALHVADALIKTGYHQNILVVASEIYSRILNPADFSTYPYFGDGAGAALISSTSKDQMKIIKTLLKSDGSGADLIQVPAGGTLSPFNSMTNPQEIYFKMVGKKVFDFAINKGTDIINEVISMAGVKPEDITYVIPHQANINIIKELSSRTGIELTKFIINLDQYGNTAGASVLIAFDEMINNKKLSPNDIILLVAFGGGLSWGATLIKMN